MEWSLIDKVLYSMGLPSKWRNLIQKCVSMVGFSILINGQPSQEFKAFSRLRQGELLSPYLFILCVKVFYAIISNFVSSDLLHGLRVCLRTPQVSHLFFTDDSFIFARASYEKASHTFAIIRAYLRALGHHINLSKSKVRCLSTEMCQLSLWVS